MPSLAPSCWRCLRCPLPAALSTLTRLVSLSLSNSELYQVPPAVLNLPHLRVRGMLECLSRTAPCLECLELRCQHLDHCIPCRCCSVTHSQHVYLEHNELRELPGGQWWSRLHVLSLDWEPLLRSGHTLLASVRLRRGGAEEYCLNGSNAQCRTGSCCG